MVSTGVVNSYDEALEVLKTKRQGKGAESKHLLTGISSITNMNAEEDSHYYLKTVTFKEGYGFKKKKSRGYEGGHPDGGLNSSEIFIREGIFTSQESAYADLQKTLLVIDNLTVLHNEGKYNFGILNINKKVPPLNNETGWRPYSRLGESIYQNFGNPEKPAEYIWDNDLNINGYKFDDQMGTWYVEYKKYNILGS